MAIAMMICHLCLNVRFSFLQCVIQSRVRQAFLKAIFIFNLINVVMIPRIGQDTRRSTSSAIFPIQID
jgi:hypothetical protein